MKKLFALLIAIIAIFSFLTCSAEDLGVQVIGGPDADATPMSLEDVQFGATYTIDGYAKIQPVEFLFVDFFGQFDKDADYHDIATNYRDPNSERVYVDNPNNDWGYNWSYRQAAWMDTGENAEFAWFQVDLTNVQKKACAFLESAAVKVVYADEYEFSGWTRQINKDYQAGEKCTSRFNYETKCPTMIVLNPDNEEPVDMMYATTYIFGCTLPNSVVEDTKSSLQMIITLDGNEIIYNIRK